MPIALTTENGSPTNLAQFTYSYQHRPASYTDASEQTTSITYNAYRRNRPNSSERAGTARAAKSAARGPATKAARVAYH